MLLYALMVAGRGDGIHGARAGREGRGQPVVALTPQCSLARAEGSFFLVLCEESGALAADPPPGPKSL